MVSGIQMGTGLRSEGEGGRGVAVVVWGYYTCISVYLEWTSKRQYA